MNTLTGLPTTGKYFVTAFPYSDAPICTPVCVHRQTKRATKMAKTRLKNSGGNTLLISVNGELYGLYWGVFDTLLYGEFGFDEMINDLVDFAEKWELEKRITETEMLYNPNLNINGGVR